MHKKAILFQVASSNDKVKKLISLAHSSFDHKTKLLFKVNDTKTAHYLDKLLWTYPAHSFLPHTISTTHSKEMICITYINCNPNQALYICNLTEEAIIDPTYTMIYDFDDQSTVEKKAISVKKIEEYKRANLTIASF